MNKEEAWKWFLIGQYYAYICEYNTLPTLDEWIEEHIKDEFERERFEEAWRKHGKD